MAVMDESFTYTELGLHHDAEDRMNEIQTNPDRLEGNKGQEFARTTLVQVVVDNVDWKILHRNTATGEYWKEFFPRSEMHGGGPPVFEKITKEDAEREFKIDLT